MTGFVEFRPNAVRVYFQRGYISGSCDSYVVVDNDTKAKVYARDGQEALDIARTIAQGRPVYIKRGCVWVEDQGKGGAE